MHIIQLLSLYLHFNTYIMPKKVLGQKILFKSKVAIEFYNIILSEWRSLIRNKKVIIFLPCASTKPIQNSQTHCFLSPITRTHENSILKVIVSEPLTLIPYRYQKYPNYDYTPKDLRDDLDEYNIFISRLKKFKELTPKYIKCYYIGGKHHYEILQKAGWKINYFKPDNGLIGYKNKAIELQNEIFSDKNTNRLKFSTKFIDQYSVILNSQIL